MGADFEQVAIVTGAGAGIGQACADDLAAHGRRVVYADVDEAAARTAAGGAGGAARAAYVDVTDPDSVDRLVEDTLSAFGRIDLLVNNAGAPDSHDAALIADEEFAHCLDVNLAGALRCARAAHAALAASPTPAIVNVTSIAAVLGMAGRVAYSSAKAGLTGMTRALAVEWAVAGIRVNAVAPSYVRTEGFERRMVGPRAHIVAQLETETPLGRLARPSEVASVVRFLGSSDASYITGQVITVDGGVSIRGTG